MKKRKLFTAVLLLIFSQLIISCGKPDVWEGEFLIRMARVSGHYSPSLKYVEIAKEKGHDAQILRFKAPGFNPVVLGPGDLDGSFEMCEGYISDSEIFPILHNLFSYEEDLHVDVPSYTRKHWWFGRRLLGQEPLAGMIDRFNHGGEFHITAYDSSGAVSFERRITLSDFPTAIAYPGNWLEKEGKEMEESMYWGMLKPLYETALLINQYVTDNCHCGADFRGESCLDEDRIVSELENLEQISSSEDVRQMAQKSLIVYRVLTGQERSPFLPPSVPETDSELE